MPDDPKNRILEYFILKPVKEDYDKVLQLGLNNGWLLPYREKELGPPKGLILLIAVVRDNKQKVCL